MIQGFFSNAKKVLLEGGLNLASDTIKVGMLKSTYTLATTDDVWGDVSADEIAASGDYVAGGVALASKTVTEDGTNEEGVFDAANLVINGVTAADVQYFIFYKDATPATLVAYADLEAPVEYSSQNIQLTFHTDGLIRVA